MRQKCKKLVKKIENWPNMAPRPPEEERTYFSWRSTRSPVWLRKLVNKSISKSYLTRWGRGPQCIVYASRILPRRPRTLRTLQSARNFGKTRFGRFAIFDFLMPDFFFKKKFGFLFPVFRYFRQILEELGIF